MSIENVIETTPSLKKNFWLQILDETAATTNGKNKTEGCSMLIVGDRSSGKTQLLSNISPISAIPSKQGAGLQFIPIDIRDMNYETEESLGLLNCWILEGDLAFENLIQFAIRPESLVRKKFILVICIDMSQPWYCIKNLNKWTSVIKNYVNQLNLPLQQFDKLKEECICCFQNGILYTPIVYEQFSYQKNFTQSKMENNDKSIHNDMFQQTSYDDSDYFGFPVLVVGTKTDTFNSLEINYKINGDIQDLIQIHLREFCLRHGAALIYSSTKNETNNNLIYRYITKLLYNFKFNQAANITDRESIFIPLGWDSPKKINLLKETITLVCPDDPLDVYLRAPFDKSKVNDTSMTIIMDDDEFYGNLEKNLASSTSKNNASSFASPNNNHSELLDKFESTVGHSSLFPATATNSINSANISSLLNDDDNGSGRMSEKTSGELANFFSTLLSSKMTSSPSSKPK